MFGMLQVSLSKPVRTASVKNQYARAAVAIAIVSGFLVFVWLWFHLGNSDLSQTAPRAALVFLGQTGRKSGEIHSRPVSISELVLGHTLDGTCAVAAMASQEKLWRYALPSVGEEPSYTVFYSTVPLNCASEASFPDGAFVFTGRLPEESEERDVGICFPSSSQSDTNTDKKTCEFTLRTGQDDTPIFHAYLNPDEDDSFVSWNNHPTLVDTRFVTQGFICDGSLSVEQVHEVWPDGAFVCGDFTGALTYKGHTLGNSRRILHDFPVPDEWLFVAFIKGGDLTWSTTFPVGIGSEGGYSTALDRHGSLTLVSSYAGTPHIGNEPSQTSVTFPGTGMLAAQFSQQGTIEYAAQLGQGFAFVDYVIPLFPGEILVTGQASRKGPLAVGLIAWDRKGDEIFYPAFSDFCSVFRIYPVAQGNQEPLTKFLTSGYLDHR